MADVGRITELWREAVDALEREPYPDAFLAEIVGLRAECGRLREQLDAARRLANVWEAEGQRAKDWSSEHSERSSSSHARGRGNGLKEAARELRAALGEESDGGL